MKKWNLSTIKNYIEGLDLDYDLEELENDLEFMIAVINYSEDSKMYELCGDKIKYNYELIKFMITKFNDNPDFIIKLANDYFDRTVTEADENDIPPIEYLEVLLTLDKNLPKSLEDNIVIEKIRARNEYLRYRVSFEATLESDSEAVNANSLGFDYIEYFFSGSVLIKDFFAYNMIDEIFSSNNVEKILHEYYKKKPKSSKSVLIELLKKYDLELAYYVAARIKKFESHLNEIEKMIGRWEAYEIRCKSEKANDVVDAIYMFLDEHSYGILSSVDQLITYFGNKYNIMEYIQREGMDVDLTELDIKNRSFLERGLINRLDSIIRLIIAGEYDSYIYNNSEQKCEIKQYKIPKAKKQ